MPGTIGFLLFNGVEELDFVGPYQVMSVWKKHFSGPEYVNGLEKIVTVSQNGGVIKGTNELQMITTHNFSNCPQLQYLVVAGGTGTKTEVDNEILIKFIRDVSQNCKYVLSVCTGSLLLQKAGLLDGKKATTHWTLLGKLGASNNTTVLQERFVSDETIWSSSGVSAGIDLALAFTAYIAGDKVAGKVQAYMEYYPSHKLYGNFHESKDAPKYLLKDAQQGNVTNRFSFFPSEQNTIKSNVIAGSDASAHTTLNNSTLVAPAALIRQRRKSF